MSIHAILKRIHINLHVTSSKILVLKVIDLVCRDFPTLLYSNMDLKQQEEKIMWGEIEFANIVAWNGICNLSP